MKYFITSRISENISETPEGYLVCIGVPIARTGEMVYGPQETPIEPGLDGKVIITRDEAEVFRPETLASFEGKSVTIQHPEDFVSPDNWKELSVGVMQNIRQGDGDLKDSILADLLITDASAIKLVKEGLREVSCGYEAEYVQVGPGRGVQKEIVGNHLALVEQGRAGSSYAINDQKEGTKMKLSDKIKSIFAKAQDEAMKAAKDESEEMPPKEKEPAKDDGMKAYDELAKMVKDLGEKIQGMMKPKDASSLPSQNEPAHIEAKDDGAIEDRLSKLEAAISKLMEREAGEMAEDAEEEEAEESEDSEEEMEGEMVGDSASRMEILAPGKKFSGKDAKEKALKSAYETKDGKKVIDSLTGGKAPTKDNAPTLFIAVSELLKVSRASELSETKRTNDSGTPTSQGPITPEKMNEINAKFYSQK